MSLNSRRSFNQLEIVSLRNNMCSKDPLRRWISEGMPIIKSNTWGSLVMGNVLAKVVVHNRPPDEVLECCAIVGLVPYV